MRKTKMFVVAIVFTIVGAAASLALYAVRAAWNTPAVAGMSLTPAMWNDLVAKIDQLDQRTLEKVYLAPKASRGTTIAIPESDIIQLCSDDNGCEFDLQMIDWDGTGRVATRPGARLFYNSATKRWRSGWMSGDNSGTNGAAREHVMNVWSCYFTDAKYAAWTELGDTDLDFAVLSWNDSGYNADCKLVIRN